MAEKTLKGRIVQKHDVEANWLKATSFIPKQGEIIIYDKDSAHDYERMKIGDGETLVSALPFAGAQLTVDTEVSGTSTNPVQNKAIAKRLYDIYEDINELNDNVGNLDQKIQDGIRSNTLVIGLDEQGEQTTHSMETIRAHVQNGGRVVLMHPDYPDCFFPLTALAETSAYFTQAMTDDNYILRFEYSDGGIDIYENGMLTIESWGETIFNMDVRTQQDWSIEQQETARTNLGLDEILGINSSNNYRQVSVTDMTFTPANTDREYPRNGDGVGIYLSEDTVDLGGDHAQAEMLEFYGLRSDEQVILSNIAPGQESYDAATVGQLQDVADKADSAETDAYNALQAATWAETQISTDLGPKMSQVQTGLGALSALFDPELIQNGITAADEGKFLRVVNGKLTLVSIPNAEDGEF